MPLLKPVISHVSQRRRHCYAQVTTVSIAFSSVDCNYKHGFCLTHLAFQKLLIWLDVGCRLRRRSVCSQIAHLAAPA